MVWLVVAGLAALADWSSVRFDVPAVERLAKPAAMAALIAAALSADIPERWWFVGALSFSLVGDVLLLPVVDRFIEGLSAFLVAHVLYVVAFVSVDFDAVAAVAGSLVALLAIVSVGRRVVAGATLSGGEQLGRAVIGYVLVLSIMLTAAAGTTAAVLIAGAAIFAASDGVLGWNRFVAALPHGRLVTHILYHVGQALIVIGAWLFTR